MRIERIGKNTVNVYITQNDLAIRHLSFSTLKEDSADYTKLVWDAIDHANIEFGREFDDRQLKIVDKFDADGCLILTISHDPDDKGDVNEVEHYSIMYSPTLEEVAFPPVINKEEGKIFPVRTYRTYNLTNIYNKFKEMGMDIKTDYSTQASVQNVLQKKKNETKK